MKRKEAIEVVKKNYPHVSESGSQFETALRTLIPELKESEDERIKGLIYLSIEKGMGIPSAEDRKKALVWLEKQGGQKPAWSEKDNINCKRLLYFLNGGGLMQDHKIELFIWMESLKERYTWKPSDEQMKQLGWIAEQNKDNMIGKELVTLYQDLKKLKGE